MGASNPAGQELLQEKGGREKGQRRWVQGPGKNLGATRAGLSRQCQDTAASAGSPLQTELQAPVAVFKAEHSSSAPPELCLNEDLFGLQQCWCVKAVAPPFSMGIMSRRGQIVRNKIT